MKRFALVVLGTVGVLLIVGVGPAAAQPQFSNPIQSPVAQPPVSPFINLFRQGNSPALNYYGLVRPQLEFRNAYQQLQQQQVSAEQQQAAVGPADVSGLPPTGHVAQFNTQGRYFMTRGALGSANAAPGGATPYRPAAASPPRTPGVPSRPPGT
jgi:hypothetical protein